MGVWRRMWGVCVGEDVGCVGGRMWGVCVCDGEGVGIENTVPLLIFSTKTSLLFLTLPPLSCSFPLPPLLSLPPPSFPLLFPPSSPLPSSSSPLPQLTGNNVPG